MKQIVDLENDPAFQDENVALLSIALDPPAELIQAGQEAGVGKTPLLTDPDGKISRAFDVLKWAIQTGEPGHTFILVDKNGKIAWIKDYGAPDDPNRTMYVPAPELVKAIQDNIK
jgi:alkyl hydroperoxide reductase subunit AhpC